MPRSQSPSFFRRTLGPLGLGQTFLTPSQQGPSPMCLGAWQCLAMAPWSWQAAATTPFTLARILASHGAPPPGRTPRVIRLRTFGWALRAPTTASRLSQLLVAIKVEPLTTFTLAQTLEPPSRSALALASATGLPPPPLATAPSLRQQPRGAFSTHPQTRASRGLRAQALKIGAALPPPATAQS